MPTVRYLFFRLYWIPLTFALILGEYYFLTHNKSVETHFALLGAILPIFYFVQKQKLEELHLFLQLFEKFNARYNEMNEELADITSKNADIELSIEERKQLVDYFNLCSEEYLYFRQGYIYPHVWDSWENGMRYILLHPRVIELWKSESRTLSYYGLSVS